MAWVKLDASELDDIGCPRLVPHLCYGKDGEQWPRIVITLWFGEDAVELAVNSKADPGAWWSRSSLPKELVPDVAAFLLEHGQREEQKI